jgi:pilin isopeptide linkage protein
MKCYKSIIEFPKLCFTKPGKYNYTIRETSQSDRCWLTDNREYRLIITVSENENGCLTASVEFPEGLPEFVNRYCPVEYCRC